MKYWIISTNNSLKVKPMTKKGSPRYCAGVIVFNAKLVYLDYRVFFAIPLVCELFFPELPVN